MFNIVFNPQGLVISLQPDAWLRWDLNQNVAFKMEKLQIEKSKLNIK